MGEEAELLTACKRVLRLFASHGVLTWRRIHVMPIAVGAGLKRFRKNHDMAGMPDLLVWIKGGPCVSIELKQRKGKQRDEQMAFQSELTRVGHPYWIVRSLDEFIDVLKRYNVALRQIGIFR